MKINWDIVNDVMYKYENFHYEILFIVEYTKITKSDKLYRFKIYIFRSRSLLFLCSQGYKVFEHDFLHIGGINSWLHANIFSFFLKLRNMIFSFFFKKQDHWCPCAPNLYSKNIILEVWFSHARKFESLILVWFSHAQKFESSVLVCS
jgi:hypothetical protein